jgi:P4 family phage/plasmid primase-like protien
MNLIGFNNGVYNLLTDEFRCGKPEDYISMSTNIDFIRHDPNSREVREIDKFMSQILINDNVRNYVIKLIASFLSGSTKNEKFHVWSGSGGNGKSKLIELLEMAMGDYAGKMNVTTLTTKRVGSGDANPELARTKGKRFVNLQEPDEKSRLNVGLMKELTGGDKIIVRALYKEPIEFKPQFKLVLTCNDKPELPANDEGTWRRVMLVQFTSKFTHTPRGHYEDPETKTNWIPDDKVNPEWPIDESLNEKFNDWTEPFMSFLLHVYKTEVKNKTMKEPKEVQEYTKQYRDQNEQFNEFINDRIIYEPDNDCILQFSLIMSEYKDWYKDNHGVVPGSKRTKDLRVYLDKNFKSCTDGAGDKPVRTGANGFRGLILVQNDGAMSNSFIDDNDNQTTTATNSNSGNVSSSSDLIV